MQPFKFQLAFLWTGHIQFNAHLLLLNLNISHIFKLKYANGKYIINKEFIYPCSEFWNTVIILMYLSLWSSLNLFVSAWNFSPRNICYIILLLCLRYPGETEHVYCCISSCSCSLCFGMEFYLWVVRWVSYVHITVWNVEGQKPKPSFLRLVSAGWDQKHIYFILKYHNKHLLLPFIFICVWYC